MKCKICGRRTNWDESYGRENFIICPSCHSELTKVIENFKSKKSFPAPILTDAIIFTISRLKEERKNERIF